MSYEARAGRRRAVRRLHSSGGSTMTHDASRQIVIGGTAVLTLAAWQLAAALPAVAQVPPPPPPTAVAPPAEPEAPASTAMTIPPLTGPLVANPKPMNTD